MTKLLITTVMVIVSFLLSGAGQEPTMIRLWAEVYNAAYTAPKTDGTLLLESARIDVAFDGPGSMDIESPALSVEFQARAAALLTEKSVVEVWWQQEPNAAVLQGAFVIDKVQFMEGSGGYRYKATGADVMSLLLNKSTNFARSYDDQTVQATVSALLTLAGWTGSFDTVSGNISVRFDGVHILGAIQAIAEQKGYHLRLSDTFKTLEFGTFGDSSGYTLIKLEGDHPTVELGAGNIAIESIEVLDETGDLVNKIYPAGAGDGDSFLTLAASTVTTAYTRQTETGPDGRTVYYLADSASVTAYGEIEARVNFKKIAPIGTSTTAIANAADDLKVAASEWLSRHKDPLEQLTVHTIAPNANLKPGDKIYVDYSGVVNKAGTPYTLKDIAADYWIIGVAKRLSMSGESMTLTLSNIDRVMMGDAQILVGQSDAIDVQEVAYKPTYSRWVAGAFQRFVSQYVGGRFILTIPVTQMDIDHVDMIISTREAEQQTVPSTPIIITQGGWLPNGATPYDLTVAVNSTTVETGVGTDGVEIDGYVIDITDEVLGKAGGIQGNHEITITTTTGSSYGFIEVQFAVSGTIITGRAG